MSTPASDAPTASVIIAVICWLWLSTFWAIDITWGYCNSLSGILVFGCGTDNDGGGCDVLVTFAEWALEKVSEIPGFWEPFHLHWCPQFSQLNCTSTSVVNYKYCTLIQGLKRKGRAGFQEPFMLTFEVNSIKSSASAGAESDVKDKTQIWILFMFLHIFLYLHLHLHLYSHFYLYFYLHLNIYLNQNECVGVCLVTCLFTPP